MNLLKHTLAILFIINLLSLPIQAQQTDSTKLPAPTTASQAMQQLIKAPPMPYWNIHPKTPQEWKTWVAEMAQPVIQEIPSLLEAMQVTMEKSQLAGVPVYIITPNTISAANQNRLLIHFHGGGYVLNPAEAGTSEAIMMAGYGHIKIISIDYRMPPDFPYPAAMDDALAVYKEIIKTHNPTNIGVFGTSTGGGISLALALSAKAQQLPLPAAIAASTPWTDLTKTGDSYYTNEYIDNVLVSYDGWLGDAAKLYANGHDLKDPLLSPIYGDVSGFPPTLLISGTRDLFLSNTIRMHWALKDAKVTTELLIFEGLSHGQYVMTKDAPETKRYFNELAQFFNNHLTQ